MGTKDDAATRKIKEFKEAEKCNISSADRISKLKFRSLKLVLFIITSFTILSVVWSPAFHSEILLQSNPWSHIVDVSFKWQKAISDPRYVSNLDINWEQMPKFLNSVLQAQGSLRIGLLNFNVTEVNHWHKRLPQAKTSLIHLEYADPSISWNDLYPEWIDEEEEKEVPECPSLPEPQVRKGATFDLIAVKLPCNISGMWSRDIPRLHLQIAAAKLAEASAKQNQSTYVIILTDCFPVPNLFTCKKLVKHEGNAWLYKPDSKQLQQKLELPIGSCELVPLKANERTISSTGNREAYATILHSADDYVCGAIAAAQSIRFTGSTRDLVILVDNSISNHHRSGLEAAGWKIRVIERIRNPKAEKDAYNEWNYSKFRLWQLTDYDKIIFIDADLLILRNIDFLFDTQEITATGNDGTLFNSGVMVIEPSNCTFQLLMEHINEITSYNGGDQGYLNEIFTWWHRIPKQMNFLKHFWPGDSEQTKAKKKIMFAADPPVLHVIHYLGLKPWLCFRDYDCNFNSHRYTDFASDEAHAIWWKVHEKMPENLQKFCFLSSYRKAHIEFNRRKAEKNNFPDLHWQRNVTDPRKDICFESFCEWKMILADWKDTSS